MFHLLGAIDFKTPVYFLYPELMASLASTTFGRGRGASYGRWNMAPTQAPPRSPGVSSRRFGTPREHRQVLRSILARTPGRGRVLVGPAKFPARTRPGPTSCLPGGSRLVCTVHGALAHIPRRARPRPSRRVNEDSSKVFLAGVKCNLEGGTSQGRGRTGGGGP